MQKLKIIFLLFLTFPAQALEVHSARYDRGLDKLFIDMSYEGGCSKNEFSLAVAYYRKSAPPQIGAKVNLVTPDACKKSMRTLEEVKFPDSLRGGNWFQILDDVPKRSGRAEIGLCIPECKTSNKDLNKTGLFKKFKIDTER